MATYLDGNVRKATPNTVKAMQRSAESRRCPDCGRKSALVRRGPEGARVHCCRWAPEKCSYDQAEGQRRWIARYGVDPDFAGPNAVYSFARTLERHRLALADADGDR